MTNLLPVVKQRVNAAIGLSGVVGGSARGQISQGTWETPRGGCGDVPNAERKDITVGSALVGSRKGPYGALGSALLRRVEVPLALE